MKTGLRITSLLLLLVHFYYLLPHEASAHCPLCVAGAGAGLTLSRILGIDDSITGIWLGAFIGALAFGSKSHILKIQNTSEKIYQYFDLHYVSIFNHLEFLQIRSDCQTRRHLRIRQADFRDYCGSHNFLPRRSS